MPLALQKYRNWSAWREGLYKSWIEGITGTVLAWTGGGVSDLTGLSKLMGSEHLVMSWKQALDVLLAVSIIRVCSYVNSKPLADEISVEVTTAVTTTKTTITAPQPTTETPTPTV